MGFPVLADAAPHLVLDHLHPEFLQLLAQLLNHIADDTAFDLYIGTMVKDVQTASDVNLQRRGQPLGLGLRLLPHQGI